MNFLQALLLSFAVLFSQIPLTDAGGFHDAFKKVHHHAQRHTKSLATDIRTAFGGVLVPRQQIPLEDHRAVYCKANQGLLGGDNGGEDDGGDNTTSASPSGSNSASASGTSTATSSSPSSTSTSSPWKLVKEHSGTTFFDDWDFWTYDDPTHGTVDYISESEGRNAGLVEVNNDGQAIMRVDTTETISGNRKSIRITTKDGYDGFLLIMDSVHMPTGCATWPAFWTNGPGWPTGGEIDIVEGVNDYTNNQVALHTLTGCTLSADFDKVDGVSVHGEKCGATETANTGCGIRTNSNKSFGKAFNDNGGGVFATRWDDNGIYIWFFEHDDIPSDITAGTPRPSGWGNPSAAFSGDTCDPFKFFYQNVAIFDTTLCGDWAGSAWDNNGAPGQEQSCKSRTGYATCEEFVRNSGSSFDEAYWQVNSVKFYQKN